MCTPSAWVAGISAVVGGISNYQSQKKQAEATEEAWEIRNEQIDSKSAAKARERAEKGRAVRARIRAGAGESGVSGISVDQNRQESFIAQSMDIQSIEENAQRGKQSTAMTANSALAGNNPEMALVETGLRVGNITAKNMEDPSAADATESSVSQSSTQPTNPAAGG